MKSLDFQSISVEAFGFGGDQFVVFAQPFIGRCSFMEWDHVQMEFRNFDNITSKQTAVEMLCVCLKGHSTETSTFLSLDLTEILQLKYTLGLQFFYILK